MPEENEDLLKQKQAEAMAKEQEERTALRAKIMKKGVQKQSLQEYLAQQEKKKKKKELSIPTPIKYILGSPLLVIFGFGLLFLPYVIYLTLTRPLQHDQPKKTKSIFIDKNNLNK